MSKSELSKISNIIPPRLDITIIVIIMYAIFLIRWTFSNVNGLSPLLIFPNIVSKHLKIIESSTKVIINTIKPISI